MTYQKMIYKSEKVCDFLLDTMYFTRNDGYIFFFDSNETDYV